MGYNSCCNTHTHQFITATLRERAFESGVGNSIQIFCPLCVQLQLGPETLDTSGLHTHRDIVTRLFQNKSTSKSRHSIPKITVLQTGSDNTTSLGLLLLQSFFKHIFHYQSVYAVNEGHNVTFPLNTGPLCSSVVHNTPGISNRHSGIS